tara:strand:- start:138 stop:1670 length:1533 start_codon:yes stop_codon:yes gene_type:complete
MDYRIVIPSKGRFNTISDKTIAMLLEYNIPMNKVYVFVVEEEEEAYKNKLPNLCNVIVGVDGINKQRDFIATYFDEDEPLVSLDDDITAVHLLNLDNDIIHCGTQKLKDLEPLIYDTFFKLKSYGLNLASIYPVPRATYCFLKHNESTDLRFCLGAFRIYFNKKHLEKRKFILLEDYETTLKYYMNDGGVLRINDVTIYVDYNKGTQQGGIQGRTVEAKKKEVDKFVDKYPAYAVKKEGGADIRLIRNPKPLTLSTLWVGENINPIVEVAWLSWLKQGYCVSVYVSNIVKENLNDALKEFFNTQLFFKNALEIMEFKNDAEILPLSDLWRYKMLYEMGGIWIDSDMILLDQLPNQEFIISSEHTLQAGGRKSKLLYKPNIGILKFEKGNELLGKTIARIEKNMIVDKPQYTDNMRTFVAELKKKPEYDKYIVMPNATCSVPFWNFKELYLPLDEYSVKYSVTPLNKNDILNASAGCFALHCWENFSIGNKIDIAGCDSKSIFGIIRSRLH